MEELRKRIKKLKVGRWFHVATESERQTVLHIALALGVVIATRPAKKGGFNCTRMPE